MCVCINRLLLFLNNTTNTFCKSTGNKLLVGRVKKVGMKRADNTIVTHIVEKFEKVNVVKKIHTTMSAMFQAELQIH